MMAGVGEAAESTEIWKSKNLYLSLSGSGRILGIKPSVDLKKFEDGDFVIGKADLVCNCDRIALGHPFLSGVFVDDDDSKVYMIGGCAEPCDCHVSKFASCAMKRSMSNVVYEVDLSEVDTTSGGGSLGLIPKLRDSVSIPKLTEGVLSPFVAKIKGDIYVLFGEAGYRACGACFSPPPSNLKTCFMVLRKNGREVVDGWSCLPHPPFYDEENSGFQKEFVGVIGNKLCVRAGPSFFSFDVWTKKWGSQSVSYSCLVYCRAITLSIPGLRGPHSVVIYSKYSWEGPADVYAALVDCDGNASHIQHIPDAIPSRIWIYDLKLIELQRQGGDDPSSSAFCLVYPIDHPGYNVGFSVVRVSLTSGKRKRSSMKKELFVPCIDQEKHIAKSSLLLTPFLKAEIMEKRWYWVDEDLGFCMDSIDFAFFY